jgi:peptidoglycan/LPS O-acetylase OafA/YrhL
MNRETSLYLDAVRFLAALAVFASHVSGARFTAGLFWQMGPYGDEAVDVFFVLSGFVIAYVTDRRETRPDAYAVSRLARVYSVALPALVATFLLDALGRSLRPDLYAASWGYVADGQAMQFLASLFFVNHLWGLGIAHGSNLAYWSLGYEVWYYVIFGVALFGRGRWRIIGAAAAIVVAGPQIIALFPLWLLGVACYRLARRDVIGRRWGAALCLGAVIGWLSYEIWAWHGHRLIAWAPAPWLDRSKIAQDYLVAILFAIHLLGFSAVASSLAPVLRRSAAPVRWAAGATFTIYLFHVPVTQFLTTIVPWPPGAWETRMVMFPVALVLLFLVAEVTERRKEGWRRVFAAVLRGAGARRAGADRALTER